MDTEDEPVSDNEIEVVAVIHTYSERPVAYRPQATTIPYLPSFSPYFADKLASETDLSD